MAIDPDWLKAFHFPEIHHSYTARDCAIYALGIGMGLDSTNKSELQFVDEDNLLAVPTMANVLAYPGFWIRDFDTGIDWTKIVHGEQSMQLHRPLAPAATVIGQTRILEIVDKGADKGALLYVQREISDAKTGDKLATLLQTTFCRGDGGFGGSLKSSRTPHQTPTRNPDISIETPTHQQMALVYRLSGDRNPLHSDPLLARQAGFPRPILHGLATYGVAGHALMKHLCEYSPSRFRSMAGRFSSPVFPGDTITTDIWNESDGAAAFRCRVVSREVTVIANGHFTYDAESLNKETGGRP